MRILFLSGLYPPHTKGGGELSAHYLAQGLRELGHEVIVITAAPNTRTEEVVDGVPVIRVPLPLTAKPLFERAWAQRLAPRLMAEISRHAPFDIIHCHDFRTAQVASQLNLPEGVVTVRDYAFICGSPNNLLADGSLCPGCEKLGTVVRNRAVVEAVWWRKPFRIWQYWHNIGFRKDTLTAFQHQVYISKAQQQTIAQRLPNRPVHQTIIYNPLPPLYLSTRPVRSVGKTILYVGTLESYKGVDLLLEVFRTLSRRHLAVHLKLVGDGAQRAMFEQHVARWGLQYRVTFAGRVAPERLLAMYDEALVVVAPHLWQEPFGRTVVEAMARERIVVAANFGGPAEIIQNNVTGFLFERGSAKSFEHTLDRALRMAEIDRREMQRAARGWVANRLAAVTIAREYANFYQAMKNPRDTSTPPPVPSPASL